MILVKFNVSDEEFIGIVRDSFSLADVINKSGLVVAGGNYQTTKKRIKRLNLDISHFTGKIHRKTQDKNLYPIADYLFNQRFISSNHLKKRLIKEGYFEKKCYHCERNMWYDVEIPIELHHIDGNNENNNLDNLIILCPNCHALTDNYRGKNIKKPVLTKENLQKIVKEKVLTLKRIEKICPVCNQSFLSRLGTKEGTYCSQRCFKINIRVVDRPNKEQLIELIKVYPLSKISEIYGVSDNTIRKWCKMYGFVSSEYSPFANIINRK